MRGEFKLWTLKAGRTVSSKKEKVKQMHFISDITARAGT